MNEEQIRAIIRDELKNVLKTDKFVFDKNIQILDARNIQLSRTTGTKIGTAIDQKLGFFGTTPVDKPETAVNVGEVISRLQELGLIK